MLETSGSTDNKADFVVYLDGLPRLSTSEAECCERPITTTETQEAMNGCVRAISLVLDGLPYDLVFRPLSRYLP